MVRLVRVSVDLWGASWDVIYNLVQAHKRLQFNALLLAEKEFDLTKNMKPYQILPLFWVQEGFTGELDNLTKNGSWRLINSA